MVKLKVDKENREKLRRLHSATHIVNYCARKVLGNHIWQNGSNLKAEEGTLDITHYENLTQDEIFKIERLVNETIFEDKKVMIEELDRVEAEQKYGFTLYQGGAIPMKVLRVVSIEDGDIEACGGIHMISTGGIGYLKITNTQKIQDGVVRLKFVVRDFASDFIENKQRTLKQIQEIFKVDESSIIKTSEKFFNDWKSQRKEIENLKKQLKENIIETILISNKNEFDLRSNFDMGFLIEIFTSILKQKKEFKLISEKFIISTQNNKPKQFKKEINRGKFSVFII